MLIKGRKHGNTGRQNAMKGDTVRDAMLTLRMSSGLKERARKAAVSEGVSLNDFVLAAIETATEKPPAS